MEGPMPNLKKSKKCCNNFLRFFGPHILYMFNVQEIKKYGIGSGLDFQLFFFQ